MLSYCDLLSQKSKESNRNVRVIEEDSKTFYIQVKFVDTFLYVTEIMYLRKGKGRIILIPLQFMSFIRMNDKVACSLNEQNAFMYSGVI